MEHGKSCPMDIFARFRFKNALTTHFFITNRHGQTGGLCVKISESE